MVASGHWSTSNLPIMWNAEVLRAGIETGGVGRAQLHLVQALLLEPSCTRLESLLSGFSGLSTALRQPQRLQNRICRRQPACPCCASMFARGRERAQPVPVSFRVGRTWESARDPHPVTRLVLVRLAEGEIFSMILHCSCIDLCQTDGYKDSTDTRTERQIWQEEVQEREYFIQSDPCLAAACMVRAASLVQTSGLNCLHQSLGD